jgi:hypothetical protein
VTGRQDRNKGTTVRLAGRSAVLGHPTERFSQRIGGNPAKRPEE